MDQNEVRNKRIALIAWVKSRLVSTKLYEAKEVAAVGDVLEQLRRNVDQVEDDSLYQFLSQALKSDTESYIWVMDLARELKTYAEEFNTLDDVESSGYYQDARLPRTLLEENDLSAYIQAAYASRESASPHLAYLKDQQNMEPGSKDPNSYVCIIASSGTGKTQLAATASLTYPDVTTIYLNMGEGSPQRFYVPHIDSVGYRVLMETAIPDFMKQFQKGERTPRITANGVKLWAEKTDDGSSLFVRLLYHMLTGERFRQQDVKIKVQLSELKKAISKQKFFVFLDEVPPQFMDESPPRNPARVNPKFEYVLCLRDSLRYLGIAPILMSTHTGAQDYVGTTSRGTLMNWTAIMSALPKYAPFSNEGVKFLKDTERPLVQWIVKQVCENTRCGDLRMIVKEVQSRLQAIKPQAWTKSPDLQLVQLFETDVDINGQWFTSTHNLVGHHFGWLTQGGEEGRKTYSCGEAVLFGSHLAVAPVSAAAEPLLYLSLVTWNDDMILGDKNKRLMFPLVDRQQNALTIRGAYKKCETNFKCRLAIENEKAAKNDGNLLEVLVHASMTLASMKTDEKKDAPYLGGMSLKNFIPLVRTFMSDDYFSKLPDIPSLFGGVNINWPTVPALGSSNSGLPHELSQLHNSSVGFLDRPADKAMVDGWVYNVCRNAVKEMPFISVECKNYRNGVDASELKKVFKRIKRGIKCGLVFVSSLQAGVFKETSLDKLKKDCFSEHKKDAISVVLWEQDKEPHYLRVGGRKGVKRDTFRATARSEVLLLVVIIEVGSIQADVSRKRKLTYPPSANR